MKMNKSSSLITTAFLISIISLAISIYTIFKDHGSEIQAITDTANTPISNKQKSQVRVYGFVCNKDGVLWESHREKIDVTQAVIIDG